MVLSGSPAHAGIDPPHTLCVFLLQRLPRACGDRPDAVTFAKLQNMAPPRMRG